MDDVGVEPERLAELASALENLRDTLAAHVPTIVNTLNGYWTDGTGSPVNLAALQQAMHRSVDDAAQMRARSDLARQWLDQANVCLPDGRAVIPWDPAQAQEAQADAKLLAEAETKAGTDPKAARAQIEAVEADIRDHLDMGSEGTAWLRGFYTTASGHVANLASTLSGERDSGPVLLPPADQKILNTYAAGLALLDKQGDVNQAIIDQYTKAPSLWSSAMLFRYGPAGSAYGTAASFAPGTDDPKAGGSPPLVQQGLLAQMTEAVYTATRNGTLTVPLDWTKATSVEDQRNLYQAMQEYDPLSAMLRADTQNKVAAGQILAGPDGATIAKTLLQTPYETYLLSYADGYGGPGRLASAGFVGGEGPDCRTFVLDQRLIGAFLTAATDNPGDINASPPRGTDALSYQAAMAAMNIINNTASPASDSGPVTEPVRQALLTTFGRYMPDLAVCQYMSNTDASDFYNNNKAAPEPIGGIYQLQIGGADANGPLGIFEQQIEHNPNDAGIMPAEIATALGNQYGLQAAGTGGNPFSSDLASDLTSLYSQTITEQENLHYSSAQAEDAAHAQLNAMVAMAEAGFALVPGGGEAMTVAKGTLAMGIPVIPTFSTDSASQEAAADLNAFAQAEGLMNIPMVQGLIHAGIVIPPPGSTWYASGQVVANNEFIHWWEHYKNLDFVYNLPKYNIPSGRPLARNTTNDLTMEEWKNIISQATMTLTRQEQTEEGN